MKIYNLDCVKKNQFLIIFLLATYFTPSAQTTKGIIKLYAYYSVSQLNNSPKGGGTAEIIPIHADSVAAVSEQKNLQLLDTQIIVYVETTTQSINWKTAKQGTQNLKIDVQRVLTPFYAGMLNGKGQALINVKKGNYLYALHLSKKDYHFKKNIPFTTAPVLLKAINKNKTIIFKTSILTELFPLPPA